MTAPPKSLVSSPVVSRLVSHDSVEQWTIRYVSLCGPVTGVVLNRHVHNAIGVYVENDFELWDATLR